MKLHICRTTFNPVCLFSHCLKISCLPIKKRRKIVTKKVQKLLKNDTRAHYVKKQIVLIFFLGCYKSH